MEPMKAHWFLWVGQWYYDVLSAAVACKERLGVAECSRGIQYHMYIEMFWGINFVFHKLVKLKL